MSKKNLLFMLFTIFQIYIFSCAVFAADPPPRPENFEAQLPVYVSTENENRINLSWDAAIGADYYVLEITSDSNWAGQTITEQKNISGLSYIDIRQNTVSSPTTGTIFRYKLYSVAYVRDSLGDLTGDVVISTNFASVSVMTDPSVVAEALSTSEIKLTWDDIKSDGNSIDYEIVKFKRGVNVGQEQIRADEIGQSAIRVDGKLEYTIRNLDKSTEYSFQIHPLISDNIQFNAYVSVDGATNISALIQRYNENIVKLIWDEYQGSVSSTDLYYRVIEITTVNGQKSYQTIATPEVPYYFAQVSSGEDRSYLIEVRQKEDDIKVAESPEMSLMDMVVPAVPIVSELETTASNTGIVVEWDVHKTITNGRDEQVKYDLWLVTDPDNVDDIRSYYSSNNSGITDRRLASNLQIVNGSSTNSNFSLVTVSNQLKYRFNTTGLLPNTIYYIGVIAKKTYIMQDPDDQEVIISVSNNSEPVIVTVRTTSGNLEQPVSLIKPLGLAVSNDANGNALVTTSSITLTWPLGQTVNGSYSEFYESDVYFRIGYEKYTEDFDKSKTNSSTNPNYNIQMQNVTITRSTETASARITGLQSNTAYVFWVKAYRDIVGQTTATKISEASDPIIVVTLPNYTIPDTKPPVPALTVVDNTYSDKITVQFNSIANMKYTIAWGTQDSIAKKSGTKEYTASSALNPDSVIITELKPDTIYYFWIKAINGTIESEWSDSAAGITIAIPPPDAPQGFGVKKVELSGELVPDIGEHYISLEWDAEDGLNYILEVSKTEDFAAKNTIEVSEDSEYILDKHDGEELQSNTRYWIRLYAKDTTTNKISDYSPYLTIKTKYNNDEYNSSQQNEQPLTGKIASEVINGTTGIWSVDLSGSKSDRLLEKIRTQDNPDCRVDLSQTSVSGINSREINISYKVLTTLADTEQNLVVKTNKSEFAFLPGSLILSYIDELKNNASDDVVIKIKLQSIVEASTTDYKSLSDITKIDISAIGREERKVLTFTRPIKIKLNYVDDGIKNNIDCYYMQNGKAEWQKSEGTKLQQNGLLYMQVFGTGTGKYIVRRYIDNSSSVGVYYNKKEIEELLAKRDIPSINQDNIKPAENITLGEAVKITLDAIGEGYTDNYIDIAEKAGLLSAITDMNKSRQITRQEALSILMRVYEVKSGEYLEAVSISDRYKDIRDVKYPYTNYLSNAIKMGIFIPVDNYILPKRTVTRGEMLVFSKRLLDIIEN